MRVEIKMSDIGNFIGKFTKIMRGNGLSCKVKIVSHDAETKRVTCVILSGIDQGKTISGLYDESQEVGVYDDLNELA